MRVAPSASPAFGFADREFGGEVLDVGPADDHGQEDGIRRRRHHQIEIRVREPRERGLTLTTSRGRWIARSARVRNIARVRRQSSGVIATRSARSTTRVSAPESRAACHRLGLSPGTRSSDFTAQNALAVGS